MTASAAAAEQEADEAERARDAMLAEAQALAEAMVDLDRLVECVLGAGQLQAAFLTRTGRLVSSNITGLR